MGLQVKSGPGNQMYQKSMPLRCTASTGLAAELSASSGKVVQVYVRRKFRGSASWNCEALRARGCSASVESKLFGSSAKARSRETRPRSRKRVAQKETPGAEAPGVDRLTNRSA
jgi:hypothetical protein